MNAMTGVTVNGGDNNTSTVARRPGQSGLDSGGNRGPATLAEEIVMDAEKSVMESFEFLNDGSGEAICNKLYNQIRPGLLPLNWNYDRNNLLIPLIAEDDDEIMGDDGLLGGTTSVDDLKLAGNISTSTNASIIGGLYFISA
jgi:hypothetical protein